MRITDSVEDQRAPFAVAVSEEVSSRSRAEVRPDANGVQADTQVSKALGAAREDAEAGELAAGGGDCQGLGSRRLSQVSRAGNSRAIGQAEVLPEEPGAARLRDILGYDTARARRETDGEPAGLAGELSGEGVPLPKRERLMFG